MGFVLVGFLLMGFRSDGLFPLGTCLGAKGIVKTEPFSCGNFI